MGNIIEYFFIAFLIYLLFRFITGFIIPLVKTTSQVRKTFSAMKDQMNAQQNGHQQRPFANDNPKSSGRTSISGSDQKPKYDMEGEYIPFEETK